MSQSPDPLTPSTSTNTLPPKSKWGEAPPKNDWNPHGYRFVVKPSRERPYYYTIYRWDPPAGYNPICEVFGMQMVDAKSQAIALASWYETNFPITPYPRNPQ